MRSHSLALVGAGLVGLASLSEGSLSRPSFLEPLSRAMMPALSGPLAYCAGCDSIHGPEGEGSTRYELVTGFADLTSVQSLFTDMQDEVKNLETIAVTGVTVRQRESDDSVKLHPEDPVYPGQTPGDSYRGTSFILFYIDLANHPSTFTLQIARDGTNMYSQDFDLATSPARRGFLLFSPQELAPREYRLHGPAKYTIETIVDDDEDPGSSRTEQTMEFFIEHK
ncbi:hypothetical protein EXS73_00750 [Candidatus Pacearchaeota archaeon]|nr:hypothetical protein [Candidatus Pacearchaeota archaeon]